MKICASAVRGSAALLLAAGIALCADLSAAGQKDKEPKTDAERLQGDWVMIEYGPHKREIGKPDQNDFNLYFHKDRAVIHFTGTDPDDEIVTTFAVDASKAPKQIDFVGVSSTITGYKAKGAKTLGIYKLDGDTLTLCWADEKQKVRPTEFKYKPDDGIRTYKFVRSK